MHAAWSLEMSSTMRIGFCMKHNNIAKKRNDDGLVDFFKNAFLGQGCFNGRTQYIERWVKITGGDFFNPSKLCDVILGELYAESIRLNFSGLKYFLTHEYKVIG